MDPQPPHAPDAANPGGQNDPDQDLADALAGMTLPANTLVYGTASPQEGHTAYILCVDGDPGLIRQVTEDPTLAQVVPPPMMAEAHLGSVMIRIVDYDGKQLHIMNASALLVEVSKRYPAATFVLQLDSRLFQVNSGCAISVLPPPRPWLRVPRVDRMTTLEVAGHGPCILVEGDGLGSIDFMEEEELVLYLISPQHCRAKRLPLLSATFNGRTALFHLSEAFQGGSNVTLRLRRGTAFAADCAALTVALPGQTELPQSCRTAAAQPPSAAPLQQPQPVPMHWSTAGLDSSAFASRATSGAGGRPLRASSGADGRQSMDFASHQGAEYRTKQTVKMLKERSQRSSSAGGVPSVSRRSTPRYSDWKPPSGSSLWTADSGYSDASFGETVSPSPSEVQAREREQPPGPGRSSSPDTGRGGQLVEMVHTMLALVKSSREKAAPAGTIYGGGSAHPLMPQLDELHDLLLRASRELPAPETLADSFKEVRDAMDVITEEMRLLYKNLADALAVDSLWDAQRAPQSKQTLQDIQCDINRTLGTAVTIASALLEINSEAKSQEDPKSISQKQQSSGQATLTLQGGPSACSSFTKQSSGVELDAKLDAKQARELLRGSNDLAEALESFARQQRDIALERLKCPLTATTYVDPVKATDGRTYDRSSVFAVIDNNCSMPGIDPNNFDVIVDDMDMRGELFAMIPGSDETWRAERTAYVESIAAAEAVGQWSTAVVKAKRALVMLPTDDTRREGIQVILDRASQKQAGLKKGF